MAETLASALAYAVSLVPSQAVAEDLVQDCYGRLLEKQNDYNLPRDGRKLLFRAVTHAAFNWRRDHKRERELDQNCPASVEAPPDERLMVQELQQAVGGALAELNPRQRAVVELRALGHSLNDVAEMLEITPDNARVLLHRARRQLAKRLRPYLEVIEEQ